MDTGIVAKRYAKALLKYTVETGGGEKVFGQSMRLLENLAGIPELRALLDNPVSVSDARKYGLIAAAAGGDGQICNELERFVKLVIEHRRIQLLSRILVSFIDQYRESKGIRTGRLTTAVPDPELEKKLKEMAHERIGGNAEFTTKVDPSIIGGFIFELDGYRMDASTATQIARVRRQFTEKNRRIV
ncbi:MAG: F0F1 ATP synthase subunit delta [Bacteroidales bacterium]|nr:F0F1 ATP synthase subunit delta [Bacteroides sp.]MCM1198921.1 F0F1 ATP synthase subunit delta [Clostridium sp.]MCM1503498.1 F0F1 ATP synthase subunit delta [Bacteroidales bacterium]